MSNLNLALQIADRGWFIFPCNQDKSPKLRWKDLATTDLEDIQRCWTHWPEALIGIYCQKSGFFVVDIDVKNGHDGIKTWKDHIKYYGAGEQPVLGPIQDTPSGGIHVLFKLPADIPIPNNAGMLGDGLDLRSDGYICAGGDYHWQSGHGPEVELTSAPAWLLERIERINKKAGRAPVVINRSKIYRRKKRKPLELIFVVKFELGSVPGSQRYGLPVCSIGIKR